MKRPLIHILIVSVVLAVFTAACGTTEATPTPVPLLERPVVTAMATDPTLKPTSAPTATALAGQATAEAPAPEPTAEPTVPVTSRPHSPRLLEHSPQEGEELAPGEPVVFTFDQPMNAASVEQALTISPELGGTLQWLDASTLQFLPGEGALLAGTRYTFALDATARAENDLALERDVTFTVRALGMLEVTGAFPVTEGAPASADAEIIVTFNRPVVPLSSLEGQGSLPNPIEIEPAVAGEGVWTNTSVFTFTPAEPLASGTTYNVTIPATLRAVRGETLAEDYRWSFSVRPPSVQLVEPELGVGSVDPETAIVLSFDQPMDRDTVSERFELLQLGDEEPVDGTLVWEGSVLRFLPRDPLPRGSSFQIRLPAGSQVANGDATMAEDQSWEMSIPALPQVTGSTPANGDSGVDLGASLYIGFSAPMDTEATIQALKITPETSTFMTWGNDDHALTISWYPQPATRYTVEISTAARDRYGVPLDKRFRLSFTTGDAPPALALLTEGSIGMYPSMSELSLGLQVMNVPAVDMDLYQLTVEDLIVLASEGGWPQWDRYNPPASGRIASWTVETKAPTNKRTVLYAPLPPGEDDTLESGTYLLVVRAPAADQPLMHLFVVSPLNVTLKTSTEEALVWVTDLASGKPVNKAAVTLYDNSGSVFAEGTTDRQGLLSLPMPKQERWEGVTVLAETEDGQGVVISNWMQGISPWDLKVNADWELHDYRTHIYTDKLLYQPGQQVLFKGFVRLDDDGNYSLPEPDTVAEVSLLESTGQTVWSERFPLSELGSLDGRVTLSESAPLGQYALVIKIGTEIQQQWFHVAEYRVPEFAVSVQTDQPEYVAGDVVELGAEATYFSGGPVSNAEVHWRVIAGGYSFDRWQQQPTFEFGERLLYGDSGAAIEDFGVLTEGAGQTGADGRFTISFPAELTGTQSRHLTFEVMVMDLSNQTITGRAQAVLHAGDGYIGINTDRYVGSEGDPLEIGLQSVSVAGEPTGNVPVQVSILQQEWLTVRREVSPGSFAWENEVRETSVHETEVTTDADGYATVNWTPETGGTFKILAEARDAKGNAIRSALYVWVSSDGYVNWGRGNNLHMDLVSDKKLYEVGDTASILVPSPFEGPVSALLTIERGGLLEHRVLTLTGNSEVIPIEIEEAFAPNVYVSVVLISGADSNEGEPGARVGTVILPVSTAERELTVSVTPDTEGPVKPGDKVTFAISVSDASGKPVAAEVSAQLVDLALETLAGGSSLSVLDTFYRERGLGVVTAMSLVRRHVPLEDTTADGKGGGGGEDDATRSVFQETALWEPVVTTDDQGQATISVTLPDNLTTWRLTAQAITEDTRAGTGIADVVSTLELMVRPAVPRFLVTGDAPVLSAIVQNNTDRRLDVDVSLSAEGIEVEEAQQSITLAAGARKDVSWPGSVTATDSVSLTLSAVASGVSDTVRVEIPVYHASAPDTVGTSGMVQDTATEVIRVPAQAEPAAGGLTVNLEPSLAASLQAALAYVETYPYEGVEQAVSRFLPNLALYRALRAMDREAPEVYARLSQEIGVAMQTLYGRQTSEGGWGWCPECPSSEVLTAYTVQGLGEARSAGFAINELSMGQAIEYLRRYMDNTSPQSTDDWDTRATILYALAVAGEPELGRASALFEARENLSRYAQGYLLMTLRLLEAEEPERANVLAEELLQASIITSTGLHWEEDAPAYWQMNTNTRTTAIVLRALVQTNPEHSLLPQVVRWLAMARSSGRWESTQENVWAILALTDYMVAAGELDADYTLRLMLNEQTVAERQVVPQELAEPTVVQIPMTDLSPGDDAYLDLERIPAAGPGNLYYSAYLRYLLPVTALEPLDRGLSIYRSYTSEASDAAVHQAHAGETMTVHLTLVAPYDLYHVVVEDPLPAGCEAIDPDLATTPQLDPETLDLMPESADTEWGWRQYWPSHRQMFDEKLALFAEHLPRGTYEYAYQIRCTAAGAYGVLPAQAFQLYAPDVYGRTAGETFSVLPR